MTSMHEFVNSNEANISNISREEFEGLVAYNFSNDSMVPVTVYLLNEKPVAWYDDEMYTGYILQ